MEPNLNTEKQARYRRKEQLKRKADHLLRKWQMFQPWKHYFFQDAQYLVTKAIELPSGWTDDDYENAENKLNQVNVELFCSDNKISNDVRENRNFSVEAMQPSDSVKLGADLDKAIDNTNALASHIISALKLSGCNEADQAAALMEAMRFVGRALITNHEVSCSPATAICLATIGSQNPRPNWFTEKLANTLSQQLDKKLSDEVGKYLVK